MREISSWIALLGLWCTRLSAVIWSLASTYRRNVFVFCAFLNMSCGTAPAILPPNTVQACDRAVKCEAVAAVDHDQCVTCLEHTDPAKADAIDAALVEHPIERWTCDEVSTYFGLTNLPTCITARWHWDQYFVSRYQGCDRAIECGIFTAEQRPECVECGGTVEDGWNAEAIEACHGGCPPLRVIPCDFIAAQMEKRDFVACVNEKRFGP